MGEVWFLVAQTEHDHATKHCVTIFKQIQQGKLHL